MNKDEFEVIENPLLVLGGGVGGDDGTTDDKKDEEKEDRNIFQRLWDWVTGIE